MCIRDRLLEESLCCTAFGSDAEAASACSGVLFSVFGQIGCDLDDGYPPNLSVIKSTELTTCPSQLTAAAYNN